jgi:sugar O-acyltransferase (sialic acid O-acetyltransferase NeuD family)
VHAIIEALDDSRGFVGFLDDRSSAQGSEVHGFPVLGPVDWLAQHPRAEVVLGVGSTILRRTLVDRISSFGPRAFPSVIHPAASIGPRVSLGVGVVASPGVIVTTDVEIGDHVLLNFGCTIGHDVRIDRLATVAPGARLSGAVHVGEGCDVGTAAAVLQGRMIGPWSILGAGAVVINDVAPNVTVVGVPARVIERRREGWQRR